MSGFYETRILPWAIHLSMGAREVARHRRRVVPSARGRVLEIGFGSGLNLPFYGPGVSALVGIDPSAPLARLAAPLLSAVPFPVEVVTAPAEDMPFDDASFDSAVVTWSLCSIADPVAALVQVRRVLKPAGALLFIEHGRSSDARIAAWQARLNPVWRRVAGGCNMNRAIDTVLTEGGFRIDRLETGYRVKGPRFLTYTYEGSARPA
jgi:ubiquinone/menaquinone biosynthesis C-methylase UbiE